MSNLLPINSYYGNLVSACFGEIGQNNTPAAILTFELTHENQNGSWADLTPVRRDVTLWLSDKARENTFADLRVLGFNGDFDVPRFADDLYQGAELLVEHEQYQGKTNERLRIAKLKPTREHRQVSTDLKRTLAAQFRTSAQAAARPAGPPPARPAGATGAAPAPTRPTSRPAGVTGDDEPPF